MAAACVCVAGTTLAHEPGADPMPERPGWQLGASAALVMPVADERWPTATWPGVLVNGSAPRDMRRGLRNEHAAVSGAVRLDERFGANIAIGWHDRERAHVEAAMLHGQAAWGDARLDLRIGREAVRMGPVITAAGHFDRFSQSPIAKRAIVNEQWIDDGVVVGWRDTEADGLRGIEAGLWRGRVFPGGNDGAPVPSLHVHAGWGHWDAHVAAARFEPDRRGAAALSAGTTGHLHGTLDCAASLAQRVCFDGAADLLAASLRWAPDEGHWMVAFAGMVKRERGQLYSTSGDAAFRSTVAGAWVDVIWQPVMPWTVATRLERLVPRNRLEGAGTALLAREAGLADGGPVDRVTLALLHEVRHGLQLGIETGHERFATGRVSHIALRAIWRDPRMFRGTW